MLRLLPLPFHLPLFRLEVRRIRWLQSPNSVRNHTALIFVIVLLISLVLWLVLVLPHRGLMRAFVVSDSIIQTLFFFSILANIILDGRCLVVTRARGHYNSVYWDLLHLSARRENMLTDSLHSLAQARMWRLTAIIMSMRVAPIMLLLLHMLVIPYWFDADYTVFDSLVDALRLEPLLTLDVIIGFLLFWVVFTLEPLWRMRAMTALSLAVRSYFPDTMLALLVGSAVIVGLWILQTVVFILLSILIFWIGAWWSNLVGQFLITSISTILIIALVVLYYRRLTHIARRYATRALFRER